ncbi:MAG TPA: hypothetical protein PLH72_08780 [Vicinamibacterales bacterium]|nr:hypothetical protein [Vicinamibacterales bacterium]
MSFVPVTAVREPRRGRWTFGASAMHRMGGGLRRLRRKNPPAHLPRPTDA